MLTKRQKMTQFWTQRCAEHGGDPRANTNDLHLRTLEIQYVAKWIEAERPATALDFGCANGFTTLQLARRFPATRYIGLDVNQPMIDTARAAAAESDLANVEFRCADIRGDSPPERFEFIFAVRAFQNLESVDAQKACADALVESLQPGGALLYLESYLKEYHDLNRDRKALGLPALPIHEHLTLLAPEFDAHVASRLDLLAREAPTSSYYLITRLIYSAYAATRGEPIDYDHPLHRLAALVPQVGEYGPQRANVFRKPAARSRNARRSEPRSQPPSPSNPG